MSYSLSLYLLGKFRVEHNGQPLTNLTSLKGQALLAYLAIIRQPRSRSALAGLLWGELEEKIARSNLRTTLSKVQKIVPDSLIVTRQTIAFNPDQHWLDIALLEQVAANGEDLAKAAALYQDELLADLQVPDALAFEEWLLVERERYRQLALSVLVQLTKQTLATGRLVEGIAAARRLLEIEPWHETGHRQLMRLLYASGQRNTALIQFESCQQLLAAEFGVEPSPETVALYEQIRDGNLEMPSMPASIKPILEKQAAMSPQGPPPHNLPAITTTFVGRQQEQARITELLTEAGCRLVSIIGPGGMGKTRLAQTLASDYLRPDTPFRSGVYFVQFSGVRPGSGEAEMGSNPVISTIGASLGVSFSGKAPLKRQLVDAIREKMMLLVLDNFEHLTDEAGQVVDILEEAPGLKVIVTSRERLSLYGECIFDLDGLPYPRTVTDAIRFKTLDSIQLFEQRAQQVNQSFNLAAELPEVAHICRLLEGMPLALEMAASWTRTLSCQYIAQEIEQNLDFLATRARNVPERQRSIRAVFEYSWDFLTEAEQTVFKKLAVFVGGFTLEAAQPVAGASALILADLVDRSLVRQEASGRYSVHELLRQFGREKLAADQASYEATKNRHCGYFADYVQQRDFEAQRDYTKSLLDWDVEIDNIRAAWHWAVTHAHAEALLKIHRGLAEVFEVTGRPMEGEELFLHAASRLAVIYETKKRQQTPDYEETGAIYSYMLSWQGWFTLRRCHFPQAKVLLNQALSISSGADQGSQWHQAFPKYQLGLVDWYLGRYDSAQAYLTKSLAISQQTNGFFTIFLSLLHLGMTEASLGNYQVAHQHHQECITICEKMGIPSALGIQYLCLGRITYFSGGYAEAEQLLTKAVTLCRQGWHQFNLALSLSYLGLIQAHLGDLAQAHQNCLEGMALFDNIDDPYGIALIWDHLGQVAWLKADYEESRISFLNALETAYPVKMQPQILSALVGLARHLIRGEKPEQAAHLLSHIIADAACAHDVRVTAQHLLTDLPAPSNQPPEFEALIRVLLPN